MSATAAGAGVGTQVAQALKVPDVTCKEDDGAAAAIGSSVSTAAPSLDLSWSSVGTVQEIVARIEGPMATPCADDGAVKSAFVPQVGAHTLQGRKLNNPSWTNQDANLVLALGAERTLVAVFDGHGKWGHLVSGRVREVFTRAAPALLAQACSDAEVELALRRLFEQAHQELQRIFDVQGQPLAQFSGSTATVALVDAAAGTVAFAHVGDSALAVAADGKLVLRTRDHVVDDAAEERVRAQGGEVRAMTISGITARRVCMRGSDFPGLAMARALGDLVAHGLGVRWEPEVSTGVPLSPDMTLVLASDGVWEKLPEDAAADLICRAADPQDGARELVESARSRWNPDGDIDDITAIVVKVGAATL